jgi:GT2 family glycosyltransferase
MTDVTVSLVAYNQRHDLERLLPSLLPAVREAAGEILLVVNRADDGTDEWLEQHGSDLRVTRNPHRAGYGENHNLNLQRARGRHFVVMNTDMLVSPGVFAALRDYMDAHADVGIVSPKVLNEDGTIQGLNKRRPTVLDLCLRRFVPRSWQRHFKSRLDRYEMRDVGYETSYDVPFLSGAFMFCRTAVLRSVGGFDASFFLYFEDVDLCHRVQRTHRTVYVPDVSVTHFWERSAHRRWIYTYHFLRSGFRYFNRWGYRFC